MCDVLLSPFCRLERVPANTGDARGTPYHLHYGIYSRIGIAQNPYPRLTR